MLSSKVPYVLHNVPFYDIAHWDDLDALMINAKVLIQELFESKQTIVGVTRILTRLITSKALVNYPNGIGSAILPLIPRNAIILIRSM